MKFAEGLFVGLAIAYLGFCVYQEGRLLSQAGYSPLGEALFGKFVIAGK